MLDRRALIISVVGEDDFKRCLGLLYGFVSNTYLRTVHYKDLLEYAIVAVYKPVLAAGIIDIQASYHQVLLNHPETFKQNVKSVFGHRERYHWRQVCG